MSEQEALVIYRCTRETFRPVPHDTVSWLEPERDLALMQQSWAGGGMQISREASCHTHASNVAMRRLAESLGFVLA